MKTNWQLLAYVRIVISYILGIVLVSDCNASSIIYFYCALTGIFIAYSVLAYKTQKSNVSLFILFVFILLGSVRYVINDSRLYPLDLSHKKNSGYWIGIVSEYPVSRSRTRVQFEVQTFCSNDSCASINGELLLYFPKTDTTAVTLEPGTKLLVKGRIDTIQSVSNPMAFDFKRHLARLNIHRQIVLEDENDYQVLSYRNLNPLNQLAQDIRASLISVFKENISNESTRSIVLAMVLGYRNELPDDVYKSFSNTGAIHILAVSGLHVGIIIGFTLFVFKKWKPKRFGSKLIKSLWPVGVAWFYVLLTGASPSITRAAFMFSLWQIGRTWFPFYNTYNILAFSALVLLLYNPYLLFNLSFIFSYTSLLSIIVFQPKIRGIWNPKNQVLRYIFDLISVSLAAQILVFPIAIFIFHKFPTYFLLAGVLVVPIAVFILLLGLLLILTFWVPVLGGMVSLLLEKVTEFLLIVISSIDQLPLSVIHGIWITLPQVALLYFMIYGIWNYFIRKSYQGLLFIGVTFFLLILSLGYRSYYQNQQRELVVYDSYKGSVIDFIVGHTCFTFQSQNLKEQDKYFIFGNYRNYLGVTEFINLSQNSIKHKLIRSTVNVIQFKDLKFSIVTRDNQNYDPNSDYLLLTGHCTWRPEQFVFVNNNLTIITDSTLKNQVSASWREFCRSNNIHYLSTKDAAVIIKL